MIGYGFSVLLGMLGTLLFVAFFIGWIVPLVMGIVRLRSRGGGTLLLVVSGAWAVTVAAVVGFGVYALFSAIGQSTQTTAAFDASSWTGRTGRIELPWDAAANLTLQPVSRKAPPVILAGTNRLVTAPCGQFYVTRMEATRSDPSGVRWTLYGNIEPKSCPISVEPDAVVRPACGAGLRAWVNLREHAGNAVMDVETKDESGNPFSIYSSGRREKPRFQVLDPAGQVLWSGNFEFG